MNGAEVILWKQAKTHSRVSLVRLNQREMEMVNTMHSYAHIQAQNGRQEH